MEIPEDGRFNGFRCRRNSDGEFIARGCIIEDDIEETKRKLNEQGIYFDSKEYRSLPEFQDLKQEWYRKNELYRRCDLVIEKSLGEKVLEDLYGPYCIMLNRKLEDSEKKEATLYRSLAADIGDNRWEGTDLLVGMWKQFWRNENGEQGEKNGICTNLKVLGVDVEAFNDIDQSLRLMWFLFHYKEENSIKYAALFKNPTMENVDISILGKQTTNGGIINDLKETVAMTLDDAYVIRVKKVLAKIGLDWQYFIYKIFAMRVRYEPQVITEMMDFLQKTFQMFIDAKSLEEDGQNEKKLYQQFYMKLSAYESESRQRDIIDVLEKTLEYDIEKEGMSPLEETIWIQTERVKGYINQNEDLIYKVYEKEKIDSNERRKYRNTKEKVCNGFGIFLEETGLKGVEEIPEAIIVIWMKEAINGKMMGKIDNKFPRHRTVDQKTMNKELSRGDAAFDKSKFMWIERTKKRYNAKKGMLEVYRQEKLIELQIQQMLLLLLRCNNIVLMEERSEYYLATFGMFVEVTENLCSLGHEIYQKTGLRMRGEDFSTLEFLLRGTEYSENILGVWANAISMCVEFMQTHDMTVYEQEQHLEGLNAEGNLVEYTISVTVDLQQNEILVRDIDF